MKIFEESKNINPDIKSEPSISFEDGNSYIDFSIGELEAQYDGMYEGSRMQLSTEETRRLYLKMREYYIYKCETEEHNRQVKQNGICLNCHSMSIKED